MCVCVCFGGKQLIMLIISNYYGVYDRLNERVLIVPQCVSRFQLKKKSLIRIIEK
jgi:hypothetical protein